MIIGFRNLNTIRDGTNNAADVAIVPSNAGKGGGQYED
jgi:hypothetical protein